MKKPSRFAKLICGAGNVGFSMAGTIKGGRFTPFPWQTDRPRSLMRIAKRCEWMDLALTSEDNPKTPLLADRRGKTFINVSWSIRYPFE